MLDSLRPTATGLDNLPETGAHSASAESSIAARRIASDYRLISITPVLTRLTERIVVRRYVYSALASPPPTLQFQDQFAFRPTGSPTAAIISLVNTVINLLTTEPYVIVLSFDFSKAFDILRHFTLLQKFAQLDLPDHIYNWLGLPVTDFFHDDSHITVFNDQCSSFLDITASIVQGSVIGPASFVVSLSQSGIWLPPQLEIRYASLRMTRQSAQG